MTSGAARGLDAEGADPAREERDLLHFVEVTTTALAAGLSEDGQLWESEPRRPSPSDHYAGNFLALALAVADPADARWRAALTHFCAVPRAARGHQPFQRLALLLLRDTLQRRGQWAGASSQLVERALRQCPLARRYPSNNWTLLAAACRVLESRPGSARTAAAEQARALVQRWTTPAGGFIDYPEDPGAGDTPVATPITYHAKALWLLLLMALAEPEARCPEELARGLGWLLAFTDARGAAGGFGRSTHALFGSACMLALFAYGLRAAPDERGRRAYALGARRLRLLLSAERRADGLLPLNHAPGLGAAAGWDEYMHLSVYNAWTAGLLAWSLARREEAVDFVLPAPDTRGLGAQPARLAQDTRAGLLAQRGRRGTLWLSLQGQATQGFSSRQVELRYGGLLPFHLVLDGQPLVAPPCRLELAALRAQPALAGWTLLVAQGEQLFAVQRFDAVHVEDLDGALFVTGRGSPVAAHAPPPARQGLAWLAETAEHHLLGGRLRRLGGVNPPALDGVSVQRGLLADLEAGWLASITLCRGARSAARLLNPHGRALLPAASKLSLSCWTWRGQGQGHWQREAEPSAPLDCSLPSSLPGARGACAAPRDWPEQDQLWLTLLGPVGTDSGAGPPPACAAAGQRLLAARGLLSA